MLFVAVHDGPGGSAAGILQGERQVKTGERAAHTESTTITGRGEQSFIAFIGIYILILLSTILKVAIINDKYLSN